MGHRISLARAGALAVSLLMLWIPGVALAHDVSTPAGHEAEDTVLHGAAIEAA